MGTITVSKDINASRSAVWSVLADYPNISAWNSGVRHSASTSDSTSGVGATRYCDLKPAGRVDETIREWEPESRIVISIDQSKGLPIASALAAFDLDGDGESTAMTMTYDYELKWGPLGKLMAPMLGSQLQKGFGGFLDDLEAAAQQQSDDATEHSV